MCLLSHFSHVQFFMTLWTVVCQASMSMGFSRQEYWSGLPCPAPGNLPGPGMEPESSASPALAGRSFSTCTTWEVLELPYNAAIPLPGIENFNSKRYIHPSVHCSAIYNSQDMEAT